MPRTLKLKVFRTPIGFHDAYVAAPSQKAAMEAWGSDKDLFARGEAELVVDPALTAEPLASPGVVIKRLRGTMAEQIAALPPDKQSPSSTPPNEVGTNKPKAPPKPAARREPRPSRAKFDAAEQALAAAKERQAAERQQITDREAEIARERRALEKAHADELALLSKERDRMAAAFEKEIRRWRG